MIFPEPVVMANREFNEISFVILDHNQKISAASLEHVSLSAIGLFANSSSRYTRMMIVIVGFSAGQPGSDANYCPCPARGGGNYGSAGVAASGGAYANNGGYARHRVGVSRSKAARVAARRRVAARARSMRRRVIAH